MTETTAPDGASPEEAGRTDRRTTDFGVICSQRAEVKGLLRHIDRQRRYTDDGITFRGGFIRETIRVAIVEAGNGFARHRKAAEILIREHSPRWVLSVGFSSALEESIRPGDLVLANSIQDTHGNSIEVPCRVPSSRRVHVGGWVVADQHPHRQSEKQSLAAAGDLIAVDTVSLAVAQVCRDADVKFMGIRAVLDTLNEEMPDLACEMLFRPSGKAWGGALGGVVKSLRRASILNDWRKRSQDAAEHLGTYSGTVIVRIAEKLNL